jgi:hypothetical protein
MKKYILFLALALLVFAPATFAQVSTQGTDFYVAFGSNNDANSANLVFQIRIVATQAANVTLTFKANNSTVSLTVPAGSVYTYSLDATQRVNVYSNATGTTNNSLRIQSNTPVSVYALNQRAMTTDATNLLPVDNYGTDYYLLSYQVISPLSDGYKVIATQNGTTVYANGTQVATNLQAGQVYTVYSLSADLTGTHITTNYPAAFFSTNGGVNIPVGTTYADILFQQMVPVNAWGNTFLVPVTLRGRERVRIIASQDDTQVTQTGGVKKTDGGGGAQNPANENSFTLDAGQYVELEIALATGGCYIVTDKPVAVTSYMPGQSYTALTVTKGDPAMAWVPPIEQTINGAAIAPFAPTGSTNLNEHYALIVAATATRDQTTVAIGSGAPTALSGGTWITGNGTAGSNYSFYSDSLTNISESYFFANPNGLVVMGYGLGSAETYYYLAGASARNLDMAFYINDIHYQDVETEVFCSQSFSFRAVIQYAMSTTPGYLKWYINGVEETSACDVLQWNKTLAPGTYNVEIRVLDMQNQLHTISTTLTVRAQAVAANITTADATTCSNSAATLTGTSTGVTNPIYRWYESQTVATPLYTGDTFTTPELTAQTTYYVSVEGDNYCENALNNRKAVTVTVNSSLTPGTIGPPHTVCINTPSQALAPTSAPGGGTGTYTYQWQSSPDNATWTNISDATSSTYTSEALASPTYFRLLVTSGTCGTEATASVLISISNCVLPVNPHLMGRFRGN